MKASILICIAVVFSGLHMTYAQDGRGFELYLLPPDIKATDLSKLDINKLKPEGKPFISTEDISSYLKDTHEMVVYYNGALRLKKLEVPVSGRPFIVFAGGQPIYTGAFWNSFSSISFVGIAIEISDIKGGFALLEFELDYPPLAPKHAASDPRSDPRVFSALEKSGILYEQVWLYGKCKGIRSTGKRRQSYVFTFGVTSVAKSTYDQTEVTFERFDDVGETLRSAIDAEWISRNGDVENWKFNRDREILLKFERRVSDKLHNIYLSGFEIKEQKPPF